MRSVLAMAEYNFTGMATSPNEMVREAMERALLGIRFDSRSCNKDSNTDKVSE